jgi:hypothetical protein
VAIQEFGDPAFFIIGDNVFIVEEAFFDRYFFSIFDEEVGLTAVTTHIMN